MGGRGGEGRETPIACRRKKGEDVAQGDYKLYIGKSFTPGHQSNNGQNGDLNLNFLLEFTVRGHLGLDPRGREVRGLQRNPAALNSTLCSRVILWKDGMFWKPQRPAKHFFPLLECTCHTNQLTRVQTRATGDADLLPAARAGGPSGSLWPGFPLLPAAFGERLLRAPPGAETERRKARGEGKPSILLARSHPECV